MSSEGPWSGGQGGRKAYSHRLPFSSTLGPHLLSLLWKDPGVLSGIMEGERKARCSWGAFEAGRKGPAGLRSSAACKFEPRSWMGPRESEHKQPAV